MRIVFFGTSSFAAHILEALLKESYEIVGIVTRPDQPKGRTQKMHPSAVKALAELQCPDIPLFLPEKASTEEFANTLKRLSPDVFVVIAYGEIIKQNLLDIPKKMSINIHPSLLPAYRGATPIQAALLHGDKETGVTIIEMSLKMDAGDILQQEKVPLPEEMTFGELEPILEKLSIKNVLEVLNKIQNNTVVRTPQDHAKATYVDKITAQDRIIDWNKPAITLHNQIRALSPRPGAYCLITIDHEVKRLGIKKSRVIKDQNKKPGQTLIFNKEQWIIGCESDGLSLLEVQLEGKKSLPIAEFLRGVSHAPQINI